MESNGQGEESKNLDSERSFCICGNAFKQNLQKDEKTLKKGVDR